MVKSKLIVFVFVLLTKFSFGQVWCYPGATWYYTHYNVSASLYTKHTYVKDTIISTKLCNKITYYTQGYGMFGAVSYFGFPIYTHVNNNVVYLLDQSTNNFDTLFNFNGVIGDSWRLAPKSVSTCVNSKVTIADTGHFTIQGKYLKWLKVNVTGNSNFSDTIIERIGCINKYFFDKGDVCPIYVDSEKGGPLRCYDDNQIVNYKHNYSQACNYYYSTGINNYDINYDFSVIPNPSSGLVEIISSLIRNTDQIIITNLLGVEVGRTIFKAVIDLSEFPNGIYSIQILREGRILATKRLVKTN